MLHLFRSYITLDSLYADAVQCFAYDAILLFFLFLQFWINGHINDDVVIIITIFFLQPSFFLVWHIYDIFVIGTPGLWCSYDFFFFLNDNCKTLSSWLQIIFFIGNAAKKNFIPLLGIINASMSHDLKSLDKLHFCYGWIVKLCIYFTHCSQVYFPKCYSSPFS